jgi:metal-responsive CopG/Arc/MetJ family transcriptional regulator
LTCSAGANDNCVVETFNNLREISMSTVNFSVPEDVKRSFDETFRGQNKSAIIAALMREAVERAERKQRHHRAIARILKRRKRAPQVTAEDIRVAREVGRP